MSFDRINFITVSSTLFFHRIYYIIKSDSYVPIDQAQNLKVVGSNPTPATKSRDPPLWRAFCCPGFRILTYVRPEQSGDNARSA